MSIETKIKNLKTATDLQSLLIEEIGFEHEDRAVFFEEEPELDDLYRRPSVMATCQGFTVLQLPAVSPEGLLKTGQRRAVEALRARYPFALYIFADFDAAQFHWVFPKLAPDTRRRSLRRMEIGADQRLHTIAERLRLLKDKLPACDNAAAVAGVVEQAFDVEAVGKVFYRSYAEHSDALKAGVRRANPGKHWVYEDVKLSRYVQLLMGRILFLHFIEKKGWLNNDRDFIRHLHAPYVRGERTDFYGNILAPLFFKALNQPGRRKTLYGEDYEIHFLNGGLFEVRREFDEHDSLLPPLVPDALLNDFLAMLGRYNFTVDESTPLDQTVGIDPEMLGKVFENLLEEGARHKSGTYYTPRTIVEYMCRETLFQHLHVGTGIERAAYENLFDAALEGRKPTLDAALADRIDVRLDHVRVLDPAVGSGAFPLGVLQTILTLKESLARRNGDSEEKLHAARAARKERIIHDSLYGVDISPPAIEIARLRLWLSLVVDEEEPKALPNLDYHIVRGDTLRTLFEGKPVLPRTGQDVGLAPGGQAALPMGGEQLTLDDNLHNPHTEALLRYMDQLYAASGEEKAELRRRIRHTLMEMIEERWDAITADLTGGINHLLNISGRGRNLPTREKDLEEYRRLEERMAAIKEQRRRLEASVESPDDLDLPFTPLHLYFAEVFTGDNPGFDIIIANPPYVRHEEIKDQKPQLKQEFPDFYAGTADLYTYFYKRGLELLKAGGHLCFIAPNKFMRAGYGKNTRALLTRAALPRVIIDFGDTPVFDATTYPAIVLVEKDTPSPQPSPASVESAARGAKPSVTTPRPRAGEGTGERATREITVAIIKDAADIERVAEAIEQGGFAMQPADFSSEGWTLESPAVLALMQKLRAAGTPLGDYLQGRFYYGIKTGFNDAFVIDGPTRECLIAEDPNSAALIKPWLRGRDIRKWQAEWAGLYVIFARRGIEIDRYPAIKRHLEQFREDLEPKMSSDQERGRKPGPYRWFEIQDNIAYYAEFEQPKIAYSEIATEGKFLLDHDGYYSDTTSYIIASSSKYLLGILNSKLFTYMFAKTSSEISGGFFRWKRQYMYPIPIFHASAAQESPIINRVQTILVDPASPDVPRLEAEIDDDLVFDLYALTDTERALIKNAPGAVATAAGSCQDESGESSDEPERPQTSASPPATVAGPSRRRGQPARSVPAPAPESGAALHGLRARAGRSGASEGGARASSTTPLDATRELDTAAGRLSYSEIAERLALRIIECLEDILAAPPEAARITPEWIAGIHRCLAGELFPDWAGRFRTTDVQVGTHLPPPAHDVPVQMRNYCLDLEERLRHVKDVAPLAELLAWADWRFQSIHPFKDFNGRVGRILLTALMYRLQLPPIESAATDEVKREAYLAALREADRGDLRPLKELWAARLLTFSDE